VSDPRVVPLNTAPVDPRGDFVLYWMIASRRTRMNAALDRAIALALELGKPLVVLEPLDADYRWASDRFHRFILDGMADNDRAFAGSPVLYHPYAAPAAGAGRGLVLALGRRSAAVVTDRSPVLHLPRAAAAAAAALPVRVEAVDTNGLLPLDAEDRAYPTAFAFRRRLQAVLLRHLEHRPRAEPLRGLALPRLRALPADIRRRWPRVGEEVLSGSAPLDRFPIDHRIPPAPIRGGQGAARKVLDRFLASGLPRYEADRNHPDRDATSGLSPYLHFGHIAAVEVFRGVARREGWTPERASRRTDGKRRGWWGMSESAEGFLDQLVTWRELGLNAAHRLPDVDAYDSLPAWARRTLEAHAGDPRPHLYTVRELEAAGTGDPLWNAAQTQLVREGRLHNSLRMLWGKRILEWTPSPREALAVMLELNDKYALDGRDPNSVSGIFWVMGRYDRPWGPERPVFGTVRYMSSANTARKLRVKEYLARYDPAGEALPLEQNA
jgi:deoxyribodipyrimidine photo-lyase